jgi:hypothetical protein
VQALSNAPHQNGKMATRTQEIRKSAPMIRFTRFTISPRPHLGPAVPGPRPKLDPRQLKLHLNYAFHARVC